MTTLHLICGKIGSGKSTLAGQLAARTGVVLISEDHWMSNLFSAELRTIDDYSEYSNRLRRAMKPHIVDVLRQGVSVVLDFPANTAGYRTWMRSIFETAGVQHELHVLDVPDAICKQRLHKRNSGGAHPFQVSDTEYDQFTHYFEPPRPDEGFNLVFHTA